MMDPPARALLSVARSVLGELDVETVLTQVLESARDVTGARYAAIGVLADGREELARFLTLGIDDVARRQIGPLPSGRGVLGELISTPNPLRIDDLGTHPHSYGFPVGHPKMRSFLGMPVLISGEPYGNLYLTEKEGGKPFTEEDEEAAVLLAEFTGVAIDRARRYSGSEERRVQLQRTVDSLEATIEIARVLAGQTDLSAILELVAKRGRALVSARTVLIELEQNGQLLIAAGAGELPPGLIGRRVSLEDTVASAAIRTRHTQRLSDELNWTRFSQHGAGKLGIDAEDGLVVPLVFRGETYGVLVVLDVLDDRGTYRSEHQKLLEAFAASAAMAVATARSAAAERRRQTMAAAEAERGRWARELHDETLQALGSLRLALVAARRDGQLEAMESALDEAAEQLQSDMDSLRALITDLRPGALDDLGIEAAVADLARRIERVGVEVDVNLDLAYEGGRCTERHVPELETALYRTVQEALTNASKHGGAKRAVVEIIDLDSSVEVRVRDDGAGFDSGETTPGFGLLGMRERVALLDGTLRVESTPGRGTTISAVFPMRRRASERGEAPAAQTG